jgi:twinkle protein
MGNIVVKDQPCLKCDSTNARQVYEDLTSFCFSCRKWFKPQEGEEPEPKRSYGLREIAPRTTINDIELCPSKPLLLRKITTPVMEFFGVKTQTDTSGNISAHFYPYENGRAYKCRWLPKEFGWIPKGEPSADLFGRDKFNSGGKRVIVVEGEIDVMSVAQASFERYQGKIYPVVGMSSSVMIKSLLDHRDWLRSFDEVVLFLDQDEAGQKALKEAIKIIGTDKVKIVKSNLKDANEVLVTSGSAELMRLIFDAAPYIPAGMISTSEIWARMVARQNQVAIPYPPCVRGLNMKLRGVRGGEISLFISGTGSGKSTLMKETAIHLVNFQDKLTLIIDDINSRLEPDQEPVLPFEIKVGIVSLEEPPEETGSKLAAMQLRRNPEEEHISLSDLKKGFDEIFHNDNIMLLDHQGSMNDSSIIDKLEHMILSGCTHLIVDHITILVSEGAAGLTGNEAIDKVMNDLLRLTTRYPNVWIGLVSHLRKTSTGKPFEQGEMPSIDDIKGSGSIKQVSHDIIAFCRNMTDEDEDERNHIMMSVLKCRRTGKTGPVPGAKYDSKTGRLVYIDDEPNQFSRVHTERIIPAELPPAQPAPESLGF